MLIVLFSQAAAAYDYVDLPDLNLTIGIPPYDVVWDYNVDQSESITDPPQGVDPIDDVPFEDSWIKILTLDNVVFDSETDSSIASRQGNVLVKYDYEPECPRSTYDWGDCRGRRYRLVDWDDRLRIYANGDYEGNDPIEDYSIPDSDNVLELRAELWLEVECKKYRLREYEINGTWFCEERYLGRRYYDDEIEDEVTYSTSNLQPAANLTFRDIAENQLEVSRGRLTVKTRAPYTRLEFNLGGSLLSFSRNAYDIESYLPDYNLLRIITYRMPHITEYGLFSTVSEQRDNTTGEITTVIEFTLTFDETQRMFDSGNCEVSLTDLFQNEYGINNLCNSNLRKTLINVSTNEKIYADGDEIILYALLTSEGVPLHDKRITVYYAGEEFSSGTNPDGIAEFVFQAEYPSNRIDVEFPGEGDYLSSSKILLIATSSSRLRALLITILPALLVLIISGYGVYRMLKFAGVMK